MADAPRAALLREASDIALREMPVIPLHFEGRMPDAEALARLASGGQSVF